jgi:3-methyladenine DNA glycosylase AlkD
VKAGVSLTAAAAEQELRALGNESDAAVLSRFFKTGPGEYGEGDVFLGVRVPAIRGVARRYARLPLRSVKALLKSPCHECRLLALLILVLQCEHSAEDERRVRVETYLTHTQYINNWDLVDLSADRILGAWLYTRDRGLLYVLADSSWLWDRRIAMLTTLHFIKRDDYADTLGIAARLLHDPHDLIHKAVGWMLREVGKRDRAVEERFLKQHAGGMPRTMLRYAIERFPEPLRQAYLAR